MVWFGRALWLLPTVFVLAAPSFQLPECAATCHGKGGTTDCYGCPDWGYGVDMFALGRPDRDFFRLPTPLAQVGTGDGGMGGTGTMGGVLGVTEAPPLASPPPPAIRRSSAASLHSPFATSLTVVVAVCVVVVALVGLAY
ncbi:Aste57867_22748 [Aphanomyces stellatus]|uniref:Aste57867_22748 protein n=1 Tax=Aphanomyces stellatus TaxID=120398 RepID=A0A485LLM9_9STRA|nr:hypothetical protein As57867_022678 [Aphanomyces stellatus]VFT99401.1 Aste57867_22748 [Aphanomyces stellatus]